MADCALLWFGIQNDTLLAVRRRLSVVLTLKERFVRLERFAVMVLQVRSNFFPSFGIGDDSAQFSGLDCESKMLWREFNGAAWGTRRNGHFGVDVKTFGSLLLIRVRRLRWMRIRWFRILCVCKLFLMILSIIFDAFWHGCFGASS